MAASLALTVAALAAQPAAALTPGTFDPGFGSGGTVARQFGAGPTPFSEAWAVQSQADGKLVLAGEATDTNNHDALLVARLNSDGTLDPSFGSGGMVVDQLGQGTAPSSSADAVAVQPDGKIIAAGKATDSAGRPAVMVARLNGNGSPDTSFGSGGAVLSQQGVSTHPGSAVNFNAIALDGTKIVLGGQATGTSQQTQFMVIRLNADGSFDSSFGSGGVVIHQFGFGTTPRSRVTTVAVQTDGKIVAAGGGDDASPTGATDFLVARLNADGRFDSSFGSGGAVETQLGSGTHPRSGVFGVKQENDGKLVVAGSQSDASGNDETSLARLNSNGGFDSSFGSGGVVARQFGSTNAFGQYSYAINLVLQPNGKILLGLAASGNGVTFIYGSLIARFDSDGTLDTSFGSGGLVDPIPLTASASSWADQDGLALQSDGKILASGDESGGGGEAWVSRLIGDAPPTASIAASPNPVRVRQAVSFSGTALVDPHGAIPSYSWSFGDGASGGGAHAQHAYGAPGTYKVTLTVTYDGGVRAGASKTVTVPASPRLTRISQSHKRWRAAKALPHIASARKAPAGTTFRFTVNVPARVQFAFTQQVRGRKVGRRCVAQTGRNRHKHACWRTITRGTLSFDARAGSHRVSFDGRVSRHVKLAPGRYTLVITAINSVGQRTTARLTFTIVSR